MAKHSIKGLAPLREQTALKKAWKDTPRSTAEQIEISLRQGNSEKQARLDKIVANCNFVAARTDSEAIRVFAEAIKRMALE